MSKQYTFRELIESQLSGVIWQKFDYISDDKWEDMNYVGLIELEHLDEIVDPKKYRIKPKPRTVRICNGIELPECVTEPLEGGQTYYYPNTFHLSPIYAAWCWSNRDLMLLKNGMIYNCQHHARIHLDAMLAVEVKEIEDA